MRFQRNPIHNIESRIKTPQSIVGKLQRKGMPVTPESARNNLTDIAGVRVICCYIDDIYAIADLLTDHSAFQLRKIKDYIKNPKPNGYRSFHMILDVPVYMSNGKEIAPVEIQIRSIAMDFWASLEHKIYYKYEGNAPDYFERELQECASIISRLDTKMMSLNEAMKKIDGDGHI